MPLVTEARLRELLRPFMTVEGAAEELPQTVIDRLAAYLELLVRWNTRTNLTAVRDPEQMVQRHLGESVFAALWLKAQGRANGSALDLGSGAGLPGIPLQIVLPEVSVLLAESQGKKVAFLREAIRSLGLTADVWPARVETLPAARRFNVVTMRAVDRMQAMRAVGLQRVAAGGVLVELTSGAPGEPGTVAIPTRSGSVLRVTECAAG